jgi:hypothetical protein
MYVCNNGGFAWIRERGTFRPYLQRQDYEGGSVDIVDLNTGNVERTYSYCGEHALRGPNDLVFDAHGGFWFTDLGKRQLRDMDRGFVYWARADGSEIREVIGPILTLQWRGPVAGRRYPLCRRDRDRTCMVVGDHRPRRSTQPSMALTTRRHDCRWGARLLATRQSGDRCSWHCDSEVVAGARGRGHPVMPHVPPCRSCVSVEGLLS